MFEERARSEEGLLLFQKAISRQQNKLFFPAGVLSLPCSNAEKMFHLARSQRKEIYCSKNIYARAI